MDMQMFLFKHRKLVLVVAALMDVALVTALVVYLCD